MLIPDHQRRISLPVHSQLEMRVASPFALDDLEARVPDGGIRESRLFVERDVVAGDLLRDGRDREISCEQDGHACGSECPHLEPPLMQ